MKSPSAGEACGAAEILFEAQELIVFGDAIRARQRSGFDLSGIGRNREIGNERILSFAGAMRDDRSAAVSLGQLDAIQRFRKRADLVDLDQDRIRDTEIDPLL
jgi:hypothetical protein